MFPGFIIATRLANQDDGPAPPPIGWSVTLRNQAGFPIDFQAAAVCVPEPGGSLAGTCAALALGARRRRGRGSA